MIARIHERAAGAGLVLSDALGQQLDYEEAVPAGLVVAYWPGLEAYAADDEPASWTSVDWAEHINDPLIEHPFAVSPAGDRRAVFHLTVRLAPRDRALNGPEWSEIAHRIARAAGIEIPGDTRGCRWVAVQAQPRRLDLVANLIRLDGTWQPQPSDLSRRISAEARRIEDDLGLATPAVTAAPSVPDTAVQAAMRLAPLHDESGPLAGARGTIELLSRLLVGHPQAHLREAGHRLEWTARRLLDLQQDLATTATALNRPPAASAPAPGPGIPTRTAAARTGPGP